MFDQSKLTDFYSNKQRIKQLEEENEEILAELGVRDMETGLYVDGKFVVEVSRNARFNAKTATELFPLGENGENMELYKVEVDSTLAKKHLSGNDYEKCQTVFPKNRVEIKLL